MLDSPTVLNLSNIERSSEQNRSRLERQNAIEESPAKVDAELADMSNLSIVEALNHNTNQLHTMFGNLSRHVNDIEQNIGRYNRIEQMLDKIKQLDDAEKAEKDDDQMI